MDKEDVIYFVGDLLVAITCPYLFLLSDQPFKVLCGIKDKEDKNKDLKGDQELDRINNLENILCEMYAECYSEDELEDMYNEIRQLSACCLEHRAEEIGLDPDTVGY